MLSVGFGQAKKLFMDTEAVMRQIDRQAQRGLSRTGGWVRTTARRSIKPVGKKAKARAAARGESPISRPGQPPFSHVGHLNAKDKLLFIWDGSTRSVVVGPILFATRHSAGQRIKAPALLEGGGTIAVTDRRGVSRQLTYQARPYMGPALELANRQGIIANQFSDSQVGTSILGG